MEVKLSKTEKIYSIEGRDETGLIPEETTGVLVGYNSDGSVECIFYNYVKKIPRNETPKQTQDRTLRTRDKLEQLNSRILPQEEMDKIAGLLKKLASEKGE